MSTLLTGLTLASVYGYTPSRLGYCGAGNQTSLQILSRFIQGEISLVNQVKQILGTFEAAYAYYQLIAKANQIADPFDQSVVEAYWLGNKLLHNIGKENIAAMILSNFVKPGLLTSKQAQVKISRLPSRIYPVHLFHVMCIGSVTGRINLTEKLFDICRIAWGKVIKKNKKSVLINYQPLAKKNNKWQLGKPRQKQIIWNSLFVPKIKIGDIVSFHWGQTCQILNQLQADNIKKYTQLLVHGASNTRIKGAD